MPAVAEEREEVVEGEVTDPRQLQLEERVLPRIGIHRVDAPRTGERVIERVAAGARDHQHGVVGAEVERKAIDRRILPAGVVDERARVDDVEHFLIDAIGQAEWCDSHVVTR